MSDRETTGRTAVSAYSALLGFAAGVLASAAAAFVSRRRRRADARDLASRPRDRAARISGALRDASNAAQEAFAVSYGGDGKPVKDGPHQR